MTTERVQEPFPMTTVAPARSAHVAVRATAPSLPTLVGIEIRKTLSTRSGKAVA
jgi:ABC-2 type transport system permease protein